MDRRERRVDRPTRHRPLGNPDIDEHAVFGRRCHYRIEMPSRNIDRAIEVLRKRLLLHRIVERRRIRKVGPTRIASNERLGKGNQLRPGRRGLGNEGDHLVDGGLSIEIHRRVLNSCNSHHPTLVGDVQT